MINLIRALKLTLRYGFELDKHSETLFLYHVRQNEMTLFLLEMGCKQTSSIRSAAIWRLIKQRKLELELKLAAVEEALFPEDDPVVAKIVIKYAFGLDHLNNIRYEFSNWCN